MNNDLVEDEVSAEEDGQEYNPKHDASSSDEEEIPQAKTFWSKKSKITWSLSPYDNQGRMAAQNVIRTTPGPTRHAVVHDQDIASTFYMFITSGDDKFGGFL